MHAGPCHGASVPDDDPHKFLRRGQVRGLITERGMEEIAGSKHEGFPEETSDDEKDGT